ncbi:uncharacterized protein LOC142999101 [Genypterus blacodes]|uniref:uncharacterized protein LOC142999101 n=1 Tax=Genypterus blacodes TaxID=154954 RepID=UPI003F774B99
MAPQIQDEFADPQPESGQCLPESGDDGLSSNMEHMCSEYDNILQNPLPVAAKFTFVKPIFPDEDLNLNHPVTTEGTGAKLSGQGQSAASQKADGDSYSLPLEAVKNYLMSLPFQETSSCSMQLSPSGSSKKPGEDIPYLIVPPSEEASVKQEEEAKKCSVRKRSKRKHFVHMKAIKHRKPKGKNHFQRKIRGRDAAAAVFCLLLNAALVASAHEAEGPVVPLKDAQTAAGQNFTCFAINDPRCSNHLKIFDKNDNRLYERDNNESISNCSDIFLPAKSCNVCSSQLNHAIICSGIHDKIEVEDCDGLINNITKSSCPTTRARAEAFKYSGRDHPGAIASFVIFAVVVAVLAVCGHKHYKAGRVQGLNV